LSDKTLEELLEVGWKIVDETDDEIRLKFNVKESFQQPDFPYKTVKRTREIQRVINK